MSRSVKMVRGAGFIPDVLNVDIIDDVVNDAELQLRMSVQAVIASWNSERAKRYRAVKQLKLIVERLAEEMGESR